MLTVGVCEDHETIRAVVVRGLGQAGHTAVTASRSPTPRSGAASQHRALAARSC